MSAFVMCSGSFVTNPPPVESDVPIGLARRFRAASIVGLAEPDEAASGTTTNTIPRHES
jgi:hypothetical protein